MNKWTKWYHLEPDNMAPSHDLDELGIYRVRIVDADGNPFDLERMLKRDKQGLVYIGRSGIRAEGNRTVRKRLKEWLKRGHSGAKTYARAKEHFDGSVFARHRLEVSALFLAASTICKTEAREIETYIDRFGEPPPFNSNKPKSAD